MVEVYENDDFRRENLFGECEKTLEVLREKRVFDIQYDKERERFYIGEECDCYFSAVLTPDMCRDLSELFAKIGERIEGRGSA